MRKTLVAVGRAGLLGLTGLAGRNRGGSRSTDVRGTAASR